MFDSFYLSNFSLLIAIVCFAIAQKNPKHSSPKVIEDFYKFTNTFELYNRCNNYNNFISFKIYEDDFRNCSKIYQKADVFENETKNQLWNFELPESESFIKLFRTQPQRSAQNCPLEYQFVWKNVNKFNTKKIICFDMRSSGFNPWIPTFLGKFPLPARNITSPPYRVPFVSGQLSSADVGPMIEYLFLSANGFAIALDPLHPWYLESPIGEDKHEPPEFCFSIIPKKAEEDPDSPFPDQTEIQHANEYYALKFRILAGKDITTVYREAVLSHQYIARPTRIPHYLLSAEEPIWSINVKNLKKETVVEDITEFIRGINEFYHKSKNYNGFSKIKIIDEHWQNFAGDFVFDEQRYPDFANFMSRIIGNRKFSLLVGLRIDARSTNYNESLRYLAKNANDVRIDGDANNRTYMIDIFDSRSRKWFSNKLKALKETYKIDSLMFEHGDVIDFMQNCTTNKNQHQKKCVTFNGPLIRKYPNFLTTNYVATVARMSENSEASAAHFSQQFPIWTQFSVQMLDFSDLNRMISSILTLSLAGYPFMMPMLDAHTLQQVNRVWTQDLYWRYTELLTFLPAMNFELSPWDLPINIEEDKLCQLITDNRRMLMPILRVAAGKWMHSGEPIIRPMWYAAPDQINKLDNITDQFMIGDQLVVAPIVEKWRSVRKLWLPRGEWINHRNERKTITTNIELIDDVGANMEEIIYYRKISK